MVNTLDWFRQWAAYTPAKIALKDADTGKSLTYAQVNAAANGICRYFKEAYQIKKGDRIAILSENNLEQVLLLGAAQKMGIILVPINFRLAHEEVDYLLNDAECQLLLYAESSFNIGGLKYSGPCDPIEPFIRFTDDKGPEVSDGLHEVDPVFILYTSGTTGFPKGAIYTHKMLFWNSINTALSLSIGNTTSTLNCMPLFHTGGWNVLLTPVLHHGGTLIMFKKFDATKVLQAIVDERLNLFMAVPTMLKMIAELPDFEETDISFLDYIIVGGERMPIGLIRKFHQKGAPIRQGYGLTEVGPNLTSLHQSESERKQGSIGKPNFYVQVRIVGEDGKDVPVDEAGELWVSGPMVTPGYWKNPRDTGKSIEQGWFKTGDMAKIDSEGFLYIVDRKKNLYISGGENVYPAEVERTLLQHEAVKEAVVFGIPHRKWGECGVALLVVNKPVSEETIRTYCLQKIARFKVPSQIHFLNSIPKNDTGKIDRKKVVADFQTREASG